MRSLPRETADIPFPTTDDTVLGGRLRLLQPARGHRAGHDAILLAAAATGPAQLAVDLGAGIGTAGLALLARGAARHLVMVEIDPNLARLSELNALRNGFADRATAALSGIERLGRRNPPAAGSADLVIFNPPFNDPARHRVSPIPARRRARTAKDAQIVSWLGAAERILKPGGRLVMIHRPEALATILSALEKHFGAVELIPIRARAGLPANRVILRAQKGKRTPMAILPAFVLARGDGRPSAEAEAVLRGAAALAPPSPPKAAMPRMQRAGR